MPKDDASEEKKGIHDRSAITPWCVAFLHSQKVLLSVCLMLVSKSIYFMFLCILVLQLFFFINIIIVIVIFIYEIKTMHILLYYLSCIRGKNKILVYKTKLKKMFRFEKKNKHLFCIIDIFYITGSEFSFYLYFACKIIKNA